MYFNKNKSESYASNECARKTGTVMRIIKLIFSVSGAVALRLRYI